MFDENSFDQNAFSNDSWLFDIIKQIKLHGKAVAAKLPSYLRKTAPFFLLRK